MKLNTWRQFARKLGFKIALTKEEQGEQALREFARKAFDEPYPRKFAVTHLGPPPASSPPAEAAPVPGQAEAIREMAEEIRDPAKE